MNRTGWKSAAVGVVLAVVVSGCSAGLAARAGSAQFQVGDVPLGVSGSVDPLAGTAAATLEDSEAKVPLVGGGLFLNRGALGAWIIRNVSRAVPSLVNMLFGATPAPEGVDSDD